MKNIPDITVVFPTYNRADMVRQTLDAFKKLDRQNLEVEFVVVDNNSSDNTRDVVNGFKDDLPIVYLFEERSGKNCALNRVLREVTLGSIIVFTDDDIVPNADWLQEIKAVAARWPDYMVFGGRVNLMWPEAEIPGWARQLAPETWAFAYHDLANEEIVYPANRSPVGPNMWVRKEIFVNGRLFNETIGPKPKDRIMGSETSFLVDLENDGYKSIYAPKVVVRHRVDPKLLHEKKILQRAYSNGRGTACCINMQKHASKRYSWSYYVRLLWRIGKYSTLAALSYLAVSHNRQILTRIRAYYGIGVNLQMLRLAGPTRR